mmetsp:Transcript_106036/g.337754  ORF Transcript_106036/g.337754 Transcript_106036/m.337754 type:complete len:271 (+) Transcript_106036:400-1212(+)
MRVFTPDFLVVVQGHDTNEDHGARRDTPPVQQELVVLGRPSDGGHRRHQPQSLLDAPVEVVQLRELIVFERALTNCVIDLLHEFLLAARVGVEEAHEGRHGRRGGVLPCQEEREDVVDDLHLRQLLPGLGVRVLEHHVHYVLLRRDGLRLLVASLPDGLDALVAHDLAAGSHVRQALPEENLPERGRVRQHGSEAFQQVVQCLDEASVLVTVEGAEGRACCADSNCLKGHLCHPMVYVADSTIPDLTLEAGHQMVRLLTHRGKHRLHALD